MTPLWQQLAWLAFAMAAPILLIVAGDLFGRWRRNRKHPDPANPPRPGPDPVPGLPRPPLEAAQGSPVLPAPAPVTHGPIDYRLTVWECGRIRMWDGQGQLRGGRDCIKHVNWDAELRAETEAQP